MRPDYVVTVCVPVLTRYDLLRRLLRSLEASWVIPACVHIIDNGRNERQLWNAVRGWSLPMIPETPRLPLGLAEAWNEFYRRAKVRMPGTEVLIVNDDIVFDRDSLGKILETPGDFVAPLAGSNAFSCFLLRESCWERVGEFDESISPGYAYYEDNDYEQRMYNFGIPITPVDAGVEHVHGGSQTLHSFTPEERKQHHQRFKLAGENFRRKHGAMPAELHARRKVTVE